MNDEAIKELLLSYVDLEMDLLMPEALPGYYHTFSRKYQKRMKRLMWSEKYFGRRIHIGYALRYVAVLAIVFLGLLVFTEVSARVLGFHPWEYVKSFISQGKMEEKIYINGREDSNQVDGKVQGKELPSYIPDGMKVVEKQIDETNVYVCWKRRKTSGIQYSRWEIQKGDSVTADGEYEYKKKIEIAGYDGEYYVKGKEEWIIWDDMSFTYIINATEIEDGEKELLRMANSLYD